MPNFSIVGELSWTQSTFDMTSKNEVFQKKREITAFLITHDRTVGNFVKHFGHIYRGRFLNRNAVEHVMAYEIISKQRCSFAHVCMVDTCRS